MSADHHLVRAYETQCLSLLASHIGALATSFSNMPTRWTTYPSPTSHPVTADALCRRNMCVYHPHTCHNDLECENAYSLKVCGHIAGQKCLLRALEKRPLCPICRHVIFAPRVVVATTLEERNDTASDRTIGVALSWQVA
jgi:hypothetical protein